MNKLVSLSAWRNERFDDPKPSMRTVRNWAANGDIPAVKRGKLWFVDPEKEAKQTGNELIDQWAS